MADEMISLGARLRDLAAAKPEAPAVTCGETTLTYAELHRRTNRIARGLMASGVKHGDLVTLGLPNSTGFIEACWAIWKVGATPQPISFRLPKAELEAIMDLAGTPVVIGEFVHQIDRPLLSVADLLAASDDDSDLPDVVSPVFKAPTSGGSTGRPKLILSGNAGDTPKEIPEVGGFGISPGSTLLLPAPLYHNAPFGMAAVGITVGAHVVLMPRFDPEKTLAEVQKRAITWLYLVPTMMSRIWRLPEETRRAFDVSTVTTLWHMAAPCPDWLKEQFIHWFGPETVMELYAGTEAQAITILNGAEWLEHRGSVGKVVLGEMKIFGEDGQPLPAGEVGEIYMRRPAGAPPSYKYLGAAPRTLEGGWESLGDIGWFDDDGYLYLADRRADMILVGGSNVYPAEIEAALDEHPQVISSAVIGMPDEDLGSKVHAIVQGQPGLDEADLRGWLAGKLVTYKQPRTYEFVAEPLRDDAGKIRRTALRDARIKANA